MTKPACEPKTDAMDGAGDIAPISKAKVVAAYVLCGAIWGTTWYGIRLCIQPGAYEAYPAAALRFTISAVFLALIWLFRRKHIAVPVRSKAQWIMLAGLFSGVSYGLLYMAERHISGGLAAVISATGPLVTGIIAAVTKTEKLSRITVIGSVIALLGIAMVFHDRLQVSPEQAAAVGILVFNCFCSASSNVVMKRHSHGISPLATNTLFFVACSTLLWFGAAVTGQLKLPSPLPMVPTLALLYLTVFGTLVTFGSFFYLLRHVRLSTAMTLAFVTPTIALLIDSIFEKQIVLSAESYAGMALVLVGVTSTIVFKARSEKPNIAR